MRLKNSACARGQRTGIDGKFSRKRTGNDQDPPRKHFERDDDIPRQHMESDMYRYLDTRPMEKDRSEKNRTFPPLDSERAGDYRDTNKRESHQ